MSEEQVPILGKASKWFLEHEKSKILKQLEQEFGIDIHTYNTGSFIRVSGDEDKLSKAKLFLQALDQRTHILARNESIQKKDSITPRHKKLFGVELETLLEEIKKLPAEEFFKRIIAPFELSTREAEKVIAQTVGKVANDAAPKSGPDFAKAAEGGDKTVPKTKAELIKLRDEKFEPRNRNQAIAYTAIMDPEINLVVLGGSAGGGKTFVGLRAGIELLNAGKVNEILVVKPRTTTNKKDLGALKGDLTGKIGPYVDSAISTTMEKLTGAGSSKHKNTKHFRAVSPDFERGETYDETFVFIDEAQNLTRQEAKMLVTRIGEISGDRPVKMIITGDITGQQNDLRNEMPGLAHLIAVLGHAASSNPDGQLAKRMAFIQYTDDDSSARSDLLVDINKAFNNMAANYAEINDRLDLAGQNPTLMQAIKDGMDFAATQLKLGADRTVSRYGKEAADNFPAIFGKAEKPALRVVEERALKRA